MNGPAAAVSARLPAPTEAWEPLPPDAWNRDSARHLLRRTGWTATETSVDRAVRDGLASTLERLFPSKPPPFAKPPQIAALEKEAPLLARRLRSAKSRPERQEVQREAREQSRTATQAMILDWLQQAADPAHSAFEKWLFFLEDVFVISLTKVRQAHLIHLHQEILRRHALGSAPRLAMAVSRSPAMIIYLDLQNSGRDAPNENFARELFELFILGEGHYTERDIKEAARAFTGYRQRLGRFIRAERQADQGVKEVFGRRGRFDGDDIIDLAYQQPAAGTFLPAEMARFYLTADGLPPSLLEPLGEWWRDAGFDLRALTHRFFASRIFHDPSFRGNYIKSPVQFHLGLLQDLDLDLYPVPRFTLIPLRAMGQMPFDPPNVRGWVSGRSWINASTLAARRQLVQALFSPPGGRRLNADERTRIEAARASGRARFTVDPARFAKWIDSDPERAASRLIEAFLPATEAPAVNSALARFLAPDPASPARLRRAAATLLQSPEYHLC